MPGRRLCTGVLKKICRLLLPLVVIGGGLALYSQQYPGYGIWQAHHFDQADFRYLAEEFWNVPHEPATYAPEFQAHWGEYLQRVPFRGIGVGTYYLGIKAMYQILSPDAPFSPSDVALLHSTSLKGLMILTLLLFYSQVRRVFGGIVAYASLLLVAIPPQNWALTDELLAEPFLRISSLAIAGVLPSLAAQHSQRTWVWASFLGMLVLLSAHTKSQWTLFAAAMVPILAIHWLWNGLPKKSLVPFLFAAVLVPTTMIVVHWIGWREYAITPGFGLHANHKTNGASLAYACRTEFARIGALPPYCTESGASVDPFWRVYLGSEVSNADLRILDIRSREYFTLNKAEMLQDFWSGIVAAAVFPEIHLSTRLGVLALRITGAVTWILLIGGLFHRRAFLLSAAGGTWWFVAASSLVFEKYDVRYFLPMSGLPTVMAIFVAVLLYQECIVPFLQSFRARRVIT